jgi:zinc transport system ATP-binding protein
MNKCLVELDRISAGYAGHPVLKNISLQIFENDFLGIIGPNGGGKTTLLKVILGLLKPETGTMQFIDKSIKENIGYLPQINLIDKKFPIIVSEVIESGLMAQKGFSKQKKREKVKQTIEALDLKNIEHNPIGNLSGGELQRTLLARALINEPRLLVLDEPDSYVDKRFESYFYDVLQKINERTAIVLVSHDIGTVISNVKNIACVNEGLHYHAGSNVDTDWLEAHFDCPFDMVKHGDIPHRILKKH